MSSTWRGSVTWEHENTPLDEQMAALVEALPGYGTATHDSDRRALMVRMTVEAPTLRVATDEAFKAARAAHSAALGTPGAPTEVRVLTDEAWADELANPAPMDLVGMREIVDILKVSSQRVSQLADTHPLFPAPLATLSAGRIYSRASVEAFASKDWRRPAGRPRTKDRPDA